MEAAALAGKRFVVLDRPNPVTGRAALGPVPHPEFATFAGRKPIFPRLPEVRLREAYFAPTLSTFQGKTVGGVQLHVHDRESFAPVGRTRHVPGITAHVASCTADRSGGSPQE